MNPQDRIIFPLDLPTEKEALDYAALLSGNVGLFKIGLELFLECGPSIVEKVRRAGAADIFLDLKLHDIPVTVERAVSRVADLGVRFLTVHCGESEAMLKAAVAGSEGKVGILGVTVLTSVGGDDIRKAGFLPQYAEDLKQLVIKRAVMANTCGCAGVVCSGHEASVIREAAGEGFFTVTPGIRPAWDGMKCDDQKRVMTPAEAIAGGSDYLVIGRPIRDAKDPVAAAAQVAEEIREGLAARA
ncbi:orotidine-5'-phosphate decarboxylase [Desulfoluna sp.]|uniref:orotidine-5'-phosphate decarboxylase n=1 Tax=Desulfoluna sp. TaxID=2045199 RepID=UPI00262EC4E4|nr:orotidine-5'-phosphate decarboxylase [Desulfoluna sp.]